MQTIAEVDVAKAVVSYIVSLGWEVYQEVQPWRDGKCADIVATKGKLVWVVEVKTSLTLSVIAQAEWWSHYAHTASIAFPIRKTVKTERCISGGRSMAYRVMEHFGIGCLAVDSQCGGGWEVDSSLSFPGRLNRAAMPDKLRNCLTDLHKTYAKAGNAEGRRLTPFRLTEMDLEDYVKEHPGCTMKEAVDSIDHHYGSDANAKASLVNLIRKNVIKRIRVEKDGRKLRLYSDVV